MKKEIKPRFFKTQDEFRKWFEKNQYKEKELYVGFYKLSSGKSSISWSQAVDVALCYGWIDGVRNAVDEISYTNRFTPRKAGSNWSTINIDKVKQLVKEGLMTESGLKPFRERDKTKSAGYMEFSPAYLKKLKSHKKAWTFFSTAAPSYRKYVSHWIMSAKQEKTQNSRFEQLVKDSEAGLKVKPFRS